MVYLFLFHSILLLLVFNQHVCNAHRRISTSRGTTCCSYSKLVVHRTPRRQCLTLHAPTWPKSNGFSPSVISSFGLQKAVKASVLREQGFGTTQTKVQSWIDPNRREIWWIVTCSVRSSTLCISPLFSANTGQSIQNRKLIYTNSSHSSRSNLQCY